ncbi:MAG: THUMP domain-containing protein [Thermoplasmata archaeon]
MSGVVLIRYGELALKSPPVRREFERQLRRNILDQFVAGGISGRLRSDHGHLYAETEAPEAAIRVLQRVFGVTSLSPVEEVPTDPGEIARRLVATADASLARNASFAVRARRTGTHPFTSQTLAAELGGAVLRAFPDRGLRVDLTRPDVELFVEVRGPRTYLYTRRVEGPGGLPLGVAGRLVAAVDGLRGALGAYLMMKRGCRVAVVAAGEGVSLVHGVLARFDPGLSVVATSGGPGEVRDALRALADAHRADGVVLSLPVEEYPSEREAWGDRVLFSPTVGLTEGEVIERWDRVRALAG